MRTVNGMSHSSAAGRGAIAQATQGLGRHSDLLLIAAVVAIIALMVLPLPPWVLDSLIATNLAVSIGVLFVAVYIGTPLGLSTFPALLLFTTLFRLSLNIASTRQILTNAHAGDIIKSFGQMVVGGDVIIGLVVFVIIALVQFIVIAKGSERIAEVAARFSLDAMPGKQMSIDADLRAGIVSKDEARQRRHALESESQLYGAMDGAMKFVKGDAIAAIVIAAVNIVGGIAIGMLRKGMSFDVATHTYSVLAVGDALVSQIPSLFMSVAAGVVVTRVARQDGAQGNLAQDILAQVTAHPRALTICGVVVSAMALVPGFPVAQFAVLGAIAIGVGWWGAPAQRRRRQGIGGEALPSLAREGGGQVQHFGEPASQPWASGLTLRLGADLMARLDPGRLDELFGTLRGALQLSTGLPFPGVTLAGGIEEGCVAVDVHGVPALTLVVPEGRALVPLALARARRWPVGLPGPVLVQLSTVWVSADEVTDGDGSKDDALSLEGSLAVLVRGVIESRPARFLGVQEAMVLMQQLEASFPQLERELRQAVPAPRLAEVGRRLLEERVSLHDLPQLAQALIDHAPREKDNAQLVERVRQALGEQLTHQYTNVRDELVAVILSPDLEDQLAGSLRVSSQGSSFALPQGAGEALVSGIARALEPTSAAAAQGLRTVVLVHTPALRSALRALLRDRGQGEAAVLSAEELRPNLNVLVVSEIGSSALLPLAPEIAMAQ